MATDHRVALSRIRVFPALVDFLRDEMGWPIGDADFEDLTFDYTAEELGIDDRNAAKIESIRRLRPLTAAQPWGIFFVEFEPRRLPVVALRRILSRVVIKQRATASAADRVAWAADDLLFISNYGEGSERQIALAHFASDTARRDLPTLKVLGWNNLDTPLHLDDVADKLTHQLAWPADEDDVDAWRARWRGAFTVRHREIITTSRDLSIRLAELARAIRDRIRAVLAIETEAGPLTQLMKSFRAALVHDLNADDFADMYAQTIAYGLLSARIANPEATTADHLPEQMPVTNPFLKELMQTFLHVGGRRGTAGGPGIDFDELGVSEVVDLLNAANMAAVVRDFGNRNPQQDPVIHFYEDFLRDYDPKKRMKRGVFYTPFPVVSYIVRSVDQLLRTEFGLADGLGDTTTWGEMAARHAGLVIPEGVAPDEPFVQILDPAVGTATFLVEIIGIVHSTMVAKWRAQGHGDREIDALWNDYVPRHLLPRLYGYELLMAPYAIAHLKLGLKLYETGYRFDSDERLRVYLTNSLEPPSDVGQLRLAGILPALAHEAQAVNDVKRRRRFTVVVGNPPYSLLSANMEPPHRALVEKYKSVSGVRIRERGALQLEKNLNDDYVKFMRLAQLAILSAGAGVAGLITNHSFFDNPTMRGMRWSLLDSFSMIRLFDLHGNAAKKERPPEGGRDENVFEIRQGVGITLAVRSTIGGLGCEVAHADLWGTREHKDRWLAHGLVSSHLWQTVEATHDLYLFVPHSSSLEVEFESWPSLPDVMPVHGAGYITARDNLVIDFDRDAVIDRVRAFQDSRLDDKALLRAFGVADKKGWDVRRARVGLRRVDIPSCVIATNYRPLDRRWIFFDSTLVWGRSWPTMQHVLGHPSNVTLLATRLTKDQWDVWLARTVSSHKAMSAYDTNTVFPLHLAGDSEARPLGVATDCRANFAPWFLSRLSECLRVSNEAECGRPDAPTPEEILHYAYAVFRSSGYRQRYGEFLKVQFPRLPLPGSAAAFIEVSRLGADLSAIHLMESPTLDHPITTYTGPPHPVVTRVGWSDDTVWLDAAATRKGQPAMPGTIGFHGVPEDVWSFYVGGYQVCEKWLKDRKGRVLSHEDLVHYQKIVVALKETVRLMREIDEVIEAHGGWPGAFAVGESAAMATASVTLGRAASRKSRTTTPPEPLPFVYEPAVAPARNVAETREPLQATVAGGEGPPESAVVRGPLILADAMCHIRHLVSEAGEIGRQAALEGLAQRLAADRDDLQVPTALDEALRTAEARHIVMRQGDSLVLATRSIGDYDRRFLKEQFLAALPGAAWVERDQAIHSMARWLGFGRTGANIRDTGKSLINGLLRERRLESDGERIRRSG